MGVSTAGVLTGTGTYELAGVNAEPERIRTRYGDTVVRREERAGIELLHIARHEEGHARLSNHVRHRANIAALSHLGADCVIGVSMCGAVEPSVSPGSLLVFDDLHFPCNRLADGSLCTFHDTPGDAMRGHWIFDRPFCDGLRDILVEACGEAGLPVLDAGCYGHVDGPRFNSRAEIRSLALAGVTAISQNCGPEAVLCGELELPYALLGYVTDYGNGVTDTATDLDDLARLVAASKEIVPAVLDRAVPRLKAADLASPGAVYRFEK